MADSDQQELCEAAYAVLDQVEPLDRKHARLRAALSAVDQGPDWKQECFACYEASGADASGMDGARHLNPGDALRAVEELRRDSDEAADWETIATELYEAIDLADHHVGLEKWMGEDGPALLAAKARFEAAKTEKR